jgi:(2Fe-2S) ferredoxin
VYKDGTWYLDMNGNGVWDGPVTDRLVTAFGSPGWTQVTGDWNGDGRTKVGVYKDGTWYLDRNGNGVWDGPVTDKLVTSFGMPGWTPVIGDWR